MLKIKLQRVGRKHDPSYRVVVTDRRTGPKSNKHVAIVGNYDAIRKSVNLKTDEITK
jgi:small subunit ribosomal protein S16